YGDRVDLIAGLRSARPHVDRAAREGTRVPGGHLRSPGVVDADEEDDGLVAHPQHADGRSGPDDVEQTPVAGSARSTFVAAARSPASHAVIDRTCSYPVASRKVGARP